MKKIYAIISSQVFLAVVFLFSTSVSVSQESRVFSLEDFDLVGNVKSCIVITNYGKEEYDFNEEGLLIKSITRYNDLDYDITYYKYQNKELLEKRVENYRGDKFDRSTSIANFYTIDTTDNRMVTEKIISYNKELLEQYEYQYDANNKLVNIKRTNNEGIDGTRVEYANYKGESTITYFLDEIIQKSIRKSERKTKDKKVQITRLTKKFLEGKPSTALEEVFSPDAKLISENKFEYDSIARQFAIKTSVNYKYNKQGMLAEERIKAVQKEEEVKNYIYQYDNGENGNWIKQIITPNNTFTTRKIKYYPIEAE
ncbi:MAG: hypothetical protein V3U92_12475 [Cellulophaga sp.]